MKHLFTSFLILLSLTSFAQNDFRRGYIIKTEGDTIQGFIAYKGEISNASSCIFKPTVNASKQVFLPNQLIGFQFDNGKFLVSKSITINNNSKQVFLEQLFAGVVNLYYLRTASQERYFVERKGEMLEMHNDRITSTDQYGQRFSRDSKQYIGILSYIFIDEPSVTASLNTIDFERTDLIKVFQLYHETVAKEDKYVVYKSTFQKPTFLLGIKSMVAMNHVLYVPSYYNYDTVNVKGNISYGGGIFLQGNIPYINEKLFGQVFVGYQKYGFKGKRYDVLSNAYRVDYTINMLRTELALLYKFKEQKATPFLRIGLPMAYILSSRGFIGGPMDSRRFKTPEEYDQKSLIGFQAGAGLEVKLGKNKWLVALDYERLRSSTAFEVFHSGFSLQTGLIFDVTKP